MGFKKYTVRCGSKSKIHNNVDLFHFSEDVSEGDCSSVTPESSMHTEGPAPPASVSEITLASVQGSPANYTQDFTSASQSPASQLHVMDFVFLAFCILLFQLIALILTVVFGVLNTHLCTGERIL